MERSDTPLKANEFHASELAPGRARLVTVDGEDVAVYNVDGTLYATQERCTHAGGPLSRGTLRGRVIECPRHGSRFDVTNGTVMRGPATQALKTYRVVVADGVARVEKA